MLLIKGGMPWGSSDEGPQHFYSGKEEQKSYIDTYVHSSFRIF